MARSIAAALSGYLAACPPFDWRRFNCAQFAAGWVGLVEGAEPAAPGVVDLLDSRRVLRELGGMCAAVTARLQREPIPASLAQLGDLVLIDGDGAQALGICAGRTAARPSTAGIVHTPMQAASVAWHLKAAPCA